MSSSKNLNILAIDTSTEYCVVGLKCDNKIFSREILKPSNHSKYILEFISELLAENNLKVSDLDVVGFGQGPGSFTGVRISASVAQALAINDKIKLVGFSSLHALAETAFLEKNYKLVISTIDARKSEVYYGGYIINGISNIMLPFINDSLSTPNNIIIDNIFIKSIDTDYQILDRDICLVGTGLIYPDINLNININNNLEGRNQYMSIKNNKVIKEEIILKSSVIAIMNIVEYKFNNNDILDVYDATPVYIRDNITY